MKVKTVKMKHYKAEKTFEHQDTTQRRENLKNE